MKRVLINGRFLSEPYTGIGQYTIHLLREFARRRYRDDADDGDACDLEFLVVVPNLASATRLRDEKIDLPFRVVSEVSWLPAGARRHYWEQVQLPGFVRDYRDTSGHHIDAVFLPYVCPPWLARYPVKSFMTVHDAIPWMFPEYRRGALSWLVHAMTKRSLCHIDELITVSHSAAHDIAAVCGFAEKQLHVIYNATDERVLDCDVLGRFGLTRGGYALYVGGYDLRKRVSLLVEMWKKYGHGQLVLAGGRVRNSSLYDDYPTNDFSHLQARESLTNHSKETTLGIVKTGFLTEAELSAVYRGARVFLHFSLAEGFNIPLVEAMKHELPALVSDIPVHREIARDAVLYADPTDEDAVRDGFARIWHDEDMRMRLARRGRTVAGLYSWKSSSEAYIKLFTS